MTRGIATPSTSTSPPKARYRMGGTPTRSTNSVRGVAPHLEPANVAGVGHYVALEAPELLAAALRPFFARTTSGDGVSATP